MVAYPNARHFDRIFYKGSCALTEREYEESGKERKREKERERSHWLVLKTVFCFSVLVEITSMDDRTIIVRVFLASGSLFDACRTAILSPFFVGSAVLNIERQV